MNFRKLTGAGGEVLYINLDLVLSLERDDDLTEIYPELTIGPGRYRVVETPEEILGV